MTLRQFIVENRKAIDEAITRQCSNLPRLNNDERRLWVLNDEALYLWARREGVRI